MEESKEGKLHTKCLSSIIFPTCTIRLLLKFPIISKTKQKRGKNYENIS